MEASQKEAEEAQEQAITRLLVGLSQPWGPATWGGGVSGGVGKSPAATHAFRGTGQPSLGPLFS